MKSLICCCCGRGTRGKQWWNRDTGFGLCDDCIDYVGASNIDPGQKHSYYGIRGIHWDIKTKHLIAEQQPKGA